MTLTTEQATEQFNTHTEKFLSLTADSSAEDVHEAAMGTQLMCQALNSSREPHITKTVQFLVFYKHINFYEYEKGTQIRKNGDEVRRVIHALNTAGVLDSLVESVYNRLQPAPQ